VSSSAEHYVAFGAGLVVLTALTMTVARVAGLRLGWTPLEAIVRAVVQLSVVALLLRGALSAPWAVAGFVALMASTASFTAQRRLAGLHRGRRTAVAGVLAGASTALVLVFGLHLVAFETRYVIAVAGIVTGNAMSAATLSGRNFLRSARVRVGEVEAWLALGATPTVAHREIGQEAAREALLPNLDQTRATGLVTLPGAFVGALFGGASPATAAQFQLVVLAGIALGMTVTTVVVTRLAGRSPYVTP
jgi:putative ABC transport system permease protein